MVTVTFVEFAIEFRVIAPPDGTVLLYCDAVDVPYPLFADDVVA